MPKKNSGNAQNREWERKRRERLNACFSELEKLLPSHDPASAGSKIKILESACKCIQSLQKENQELVDGSENNPEIKLTYVNSLRRRVKALVSRVRQLAGLLRAAGITVPEAQDGGGVEEALDDEVVPPSEPNNLPPALGPRPMRWSNKIKPQEAALLLEKVQALKRAKKPKKPESKKVSKKLNNTTKPLKISNKTANEATRKKNRRPPKLKEKALSNLLNQAEDKNRARYILVHKKEFHKYIVVPAATPAPIPPTSTPSNISLLGTSTTLLVTPPASTTTVNSSLSLIMQPRPLILTNALLPAVLQSGPARFIQVGAPPVLPPPPPPQLPPPPPQPPPVISSLSTNHFPLTTQTFNRPNFPILAPKLMDVTRTTIANKKPISALKATPRSKPSKNKNASNANNKSKFNETDKKVKEEANQTVLKRKSKDKEQTESGNKKQKLEKDKESTKENDKSKNYTIDALCKSKETINKKTKDLMSENNKIKETEINTSSNLRTVDNSLSAEPSGITSNESANILNTNSSFDNSSAIYTPFNITNSKIHCPLNTSNSRLQCNTDPLNNEPLPNININEDFSCTSNAIVNSSQENTINTSAPITSAVNISSNVLNTIINNTSATNTPTTNTSNDIILNITNEKSDSLNKEKKTDSNSLELETNKKTSLENTFIPIASSDHLDAQSLLQNSDYAGDLFASLNVSAGSHHPELISPTAAFLLAFPLVSTSKNTDNDVSEEPCQDGASTLLQISNLDNNSIINCVARDHMEVSKDPITLPTNSEKEQDQSKTKWINNNPSKNIPEKASSDSIAIEKTQEYEKQSQTNISFSKNLQSFPKENTFVKENNPSNNYTKDQSHFDKEQNLNFEKEMNTAYNKNSIEYPKEQNNFNSSNLYNKTPDNYPKQTNNFNKSQATFNKSTSNSSTSTFTKVQDNFSKSQTNFSKNSTETKAQNSFNNVRVDEHCNSFTKEPTQNVYETQKSLFEKTQTNFTKQQKQQQQHNFQKESNPFQVERNNYNKVDSTQVAYSKCLPQHQQQQQIRFQTKDTIIPQYNNNEQQFQKEQQNFNLDINFSKEPNILPTNSNNQFRKNQHHYIQKEQHLFSDKDQNNIFQEKDQLFPQKDHSDLYQQKEQQLFHHKDDQLFHPKEQQHNIFSQKEQHIMQQQQKDTQIYQHKDPQKQQHIFQLKDQELFSKDHSIFQHKDQLSKENNIFQQKEQHLLNKGQQKQQHIFQQKDQELFSKDHSIFQHKDQLSKENNIFQQKEQHLFNKQQQKQQHIFQQKDQELFSKDHSIFQHKDQLPKENNIFQQKDQELFSKDHSIFQHKDQLSKENNIFQQKEQHLFNKQQQKQQHIFQQKDQELFSKDHSIFQHKDQLPKENNIFQQKDQELFSKDHSIFQHKDQLPKENIFQQKEQHIFNKEQQLFQKEQQFSAKNPQDYNKDPFFMPDLRNKEDTNLFAPHQFPAQAPTLHTQTQTQTQPPMQQQTNFQTSHTLPDITNAQFENFKLSKNQQTFDFGLDKRPSNQNNFDTLNTKQTDYTNIINKNMNQEFQNNKEITNKDKNVPVSNAQIKMYNNYPPTTYSYMFNDFSNFTPSYTQANTTQNNTKTTTTSSNFMSWNPVSVSQTPSTSTFDNFTMKTNLLPDTLDLNLDFGNIDKNRKLPDFFPTSFTNEEFRTDFREDLQTNLPTIRNDKDTNFNNPISINSNNNNNNTNNKSNQRPPVNWMTAPDLRSTLPTEETPKDLDFSNNNFNNNFFNNQTLANTTCDQDFTLWPSRKMLGADLSNALFTPSTLPTLVGDLALGTNFPMCIEEGKSFTNNFENEKEDKTKPDKSKSNSKKQPTECSPFLSVSQLMDPKVKNQKSKKQANPSNKQSSSRNMNKRQETRKETQFDDFHCRTNQWQGQDKRFQRNNSYSAEALIGVNSEIDQTTKVTNIPPPMVTEKFAQSYTSTQPPVPQPRNTLSAFPASTTDASFNYLPNITDIQTADLTSTFNNNTSTFNYAPPTGPTSAPVYSANSMATFISDNNDTSFMFAQTHQQQQQGQTVTSQVQQIPPPPPQLSHTTRGGCAGTSKARNRRKQPEVSVHNSTASSVTTSTVSGISSLVDLGYLSLPHTIQSPLMDENTSLINHGTGLLASTQPSTGLYQATSQPSTSVCVGKIHSQVQPMPIPPPGLSTTSSLTNFNLSTIFPEINDKVPSYGPNKVGSHNHNQRHQQTATNLPPLNGIWPT